MVDVCATVFLGTVYPLFIEAFTNNKISVGEPYFNSTVIPILIPAILVMGVGPLMSWGKTNPDNEEAVFNDGIRSFSDLDLFFKHLNMYMKDLIYSCPKAWGQFQEKYNTSHKAIS